MTKFQKIKDKIKRIYITFKGDSSIFSRTREISTPEGREMAPRSRYCPAFWQARDRSQRLSLRTSKRLSLNIRGCLLEADTAQKAAFFNAAIGSISKKVYLLAGFFNEPEHQNSEYSNQNNESPGTIDDTGDLGIHKLFSLFGNYNSDSYEQKHRDDSGQIVISQNVAHFSFDKYTAKNNDSKPNISPLIISKESAAEKAGIVSDGTTTTAISHAVAKLTRNSDKVFNWDLSSIYYDYNNWQDSVKRTEIVYQEVGLILSRGNDFQNFLFSQGSGGITQSHANIFGSYIGVLFWNFFNGITGSQKVQNIGNSNSGSLNARLAKSNLLLDDDGSTDVVFGSCFHEYNDNLFTGNVKSIITS